MQQSQELASYRSHIEALKTDVPSPAQYTYPALAKLLWPSFGAPQLSFARGADDQQKWLLVLLLQQCTNPPPTEHWRWWQILGRCVLSSAFLGLQVWLQALDAVGLCRRALKSWRLPQQLQTLPAEGRATALTGDWTSIDRSPFSLDTMSRSYEQDITICA